MARVRNNQGYRKKALDLHIRPYLEQENTQEREAFLQAREVIKPLQDETWKLAKTIVRRHYTDEDVKMAYHLQNKFENVDTIAKDSCFHFGYQAKADSEHEEDYFNEKHFDFRLDGNINGQESSRTNNFAYAYFRDEIKGKVNKGEKCNPDIDIEQKWGNGSGEENQSNPHWTSCKHANERELGLYGGDDNKTLYAREWNYDYELDLIGREYCRDRQIAVSKQEFDTFVIWQQKKGQLIMAHYKWIKSILTQMKEIKMGLKGYKYLDEMIELGTELGLSISDAEIIRCNSGGLVIYNPKNLAERIKGMKNKNHSREQKIKERILYESQQSGVVN